MRKSRTKPKTRMRVNANIIAPLLTLDEIQQRYGRPQTFGNPDEDTVMALDEAIRPTMGLLHHSISVMGNDAFPQFLGYGYLTMLAQDGLIRAGVSMIAKEMTAKWIMLQRQGDSHGDDETIIALTEEMKRFKLQSLFREVGENCGYFGGCLVYIDTGETGNKLLEPLKLDPATLPIGTIKGFKLVEPFNVTPGTYDSTNPLAQNYYKPSMWWVQGTPVHASRFLYFEQNRLPSMLLPTYNFFGIPLAQSVLDAVGHFTECREASARLLTKFSMTVLKTDMSEVLSGGSGENQARRVQYMVQNRTNDGVEVIDKEQEDIVNVSTPLSGVTDIVRQSMEMVSAYFNEPCTKMWGISPAGMNATGDSDMKNHYAHIESQQEEIFRSELERVLKILQLNKFGVIDESITLKFNKLSDEDETAVTTRQKTKAETDNIYLTAGVVSPEEVRAKIAEDQQSGYNNIDPDQLPEIPEEQEGEANGSESTQGSTTPNAEVTAGNSQ